LTVTKSNGTTRIIQSFQLSAAIDKDKEVQKRRLDGITCFITNDLTIPQGEVVQKYRDKNKIEEAFREMKSQLALRPIYLTRPERVKAHVTICIMAYLLINSMEMMLRKAEIELSSEELLRQVSNCRLSQVG
ncbi:IS1634 family transposase, partial [Desulfosporosinus metallidurans]